MTEANKQWWCPKCHKKKRANYIFQPKGVTCSGCGEIVHCVWEIPPPTPDKTDYVELAEEFHEQNDNVKNKLTAIEYIYYRTGITHFIEWLNERKKDGNEES